MWRIMCVFATYTGVAKAFRLKASLSLKSAGSILFWWHEIFLSYYRMSNKYTQLQ